MKINWGTGLVIGMVLFISFILFFVIKISTQDKYDFDLVTEDYYQKELVFQKEMDDQTNSHSLKSKVKGKRTAEGWLISFPEEVDYSKVSGTVLMYRPSNKKLDFEMPLKLSSSTLLIPDEKLVGGRWNTIVHWSIDGEDYLFKDEIIY
ncbi:FixH family protein [Aequorivita sinensis]|uniref:FixH family protein n=1 Tax=Aequorivita sinensis TaxID=1382458 RepID=UPI00230005D8|nr:FixH family protein [Aequorivita sinensis]